MEHLYTVKDTKTRTFNRPFCERSDAIAIRNLRMEVNRNDAKNPLYMFPEDYEVYRIGSMDPDTGMVTSQTPELISTGLALVEQALVEKTTPSTTR